MMNRVLPAHSSFRIHHSVYNGAAIEFCEGQGGSWAMPHEPGHTDEHKGEHRAMLPEDAPTWQIDIAEGADIVTADGDKIGTVKEVRGGYFKVNAHLQVDYWLQRQFVTHNADGRVTMSFNKDDLGDYKVAEPPT